MITSFCGRGFRICKSCTGSRQAVVNEPFSPSKKKLSYVLWISLHSRRLLLWLSRLQRWGDDCWTQEIYGREILGVMDQIGLGQLKNVKLTVLLLGCLNFAIFVTGILVALGSSHGKCSRNVTLAAIVIGWGAGMRLIWMFGMGFAQAVTASTMVAGEEDRLHSRTQGSNFTRHQRRTWYQRWLWWSRVGTILTVLQVSGVCYFAWSLARNVSIKDRHVTFCPQGEDRIKQMWLMVLMLALPSVGGIIVFAQCCVGSDVLAWRLLYGAHYEAWRAHYRQMFDHGIREVLCCLGRRRYMSVLEEDEVDSVAALLGDLVAYRAAGASHLEVIAGIALLREETLKTSSEEEFLPAPDALVREAAVLHPYAVAAYTGPLLDVGRHPLTFPCAWLYRQGVLTPWNRNRRPVLEGDNWWRGHAAAFLRHAELPPDALRQGRVLQEDFDGGMPNIQTNRESVYFVVVLHQLRYVLVAIRGTETPEDLITDGLGREIALTESDLCGILKNRAISHRVKQEVLATMPHFGHGGVIEAARELAMQLDNLGEDEEIVGHARKAPLPDSHNSNKDASSSEGLRESSMSNKKGLLSSLLGPGCECDGYSLRLVGHSLGGAIAALTGLQLASRYPNLHVYTFGVLPSVDLVTAEACSTFTTSIIYNDEFSSRLSVAAILRLRAAALRALAADTSTDSDLVTKLTRRLFKTSSSLTDLEAGSSNPDRQRMRRRYSSALKGGAFLCSHACRCVVQMPKHSSSRHPPGVQLTNFRHEDCGDFESKTLTDECNEKYEDTTGQGTRISLGASGKGLDGFYEQWCEPSNGVSLLADRDTVGIDAGTEIRNEEEAEALMSSESGRQGLEGEEEEYPWTSLELLDNGMPKDMGGFDMGSDVEELWPAEMFVPGLVIHLTRSAGNNNWFALPSNLSFYGNPKVENKRSRHSAVLKDRKRFRDILVSPSMFLDHMPWKCQYALNDILGQMNAAQQRRGASSVESITMA